MSQNKNTITITEQLGRRAQHLGLVMMTMAATLGMAELPHHEEAKVTITPHYLAFAGVEVGGDHGDSMRREREETGPHYTSYGASQRTPSRAGRI